MHIRQSKGRKDRYVPMGRLLMDEIKNYLVHNKPVKWLFNGKNFNGYSPQGVQRAIREAQRKTLIQKRITPHTLRHTYATHLLEQGLDIVSIKELLGHSYIQTTMVYLHVVMKDNKVVFSPLDTLYNKSESEFKDDNMPQSFNYENQFYLNILQKRAEKRLQRTAQDTRQFEFAFFRLLLKNNSVKPHQAQVLKGFIVYRVVTRIHSWLCMVIFLTSFRIKIKSFRLWQYAGEYFSRLRL